MEITVRVAEQAGVMFLLMAIGFGCRKGGVFTDEFTSKLSWVLLNLVMPAVILQSLQMERDEALARGMLWSLVLAIVLQLLSILIARLFTPRKEDARYRVERFGAALSNCGFIGLPLTEAVVGPRGTVYAGIFIVVFNFLLFTYGTAMMSGTRTTPKQVAKIFATPAMIALAVGLVFFFLSVRLPVIPAQAVSYLSGLNTPIAMLAAGSYIARGNLRRIFVTGRLYLLSAVRLLLIPAVSLGILLLLPVEREVALTMLVLVACPSPMLVMALAEKHGSDPVHAAGLIAMTTLLSVISLPLMVAASAALGI